MFKKVDKEFLITDSTMNVYGYRLLTNGYLLDEFKKNPIGYHMHADEDNTDFTRKDGVLVKWEDFRVDGDKVFAKPCINLSHPRGQRTLDEIESGFLNAASVGKIVAIEISDNPDDYLPGQTGPTVKKWFNRELSLVDIPGNYNALTSLLDVNNHPIDLADFNTQKIKMKQIFLTPAQLSLMNLKADTADQAAADLAFANLVAKANSADALQTQLNEEKRLHKESKDKLTALETADSSAKVNDLVDKALNVDKKITAEMAASLKKDYATNPTSLKALLDAMPKSPSITEQIKNTGKADDLASKTWDELDASDKLENLLAKDKALFNQKGRERFGDTWVDR